MSQRHATDVVSLVFGTIFAGFTVIWLVALDDRFDHVAWWAGPLVLVVAGVAGLAAALPRGHDPLDEEPVPTDTEQADRAGTDPSYHRFGG